MQELRTAMGKCMVAVFCTMAVAMCMKAYSRMGYGMDRGSYAAQTETNTTGSGNMTSDTEEALSLALMGVIMKVK